MSRNTPRSKVVSIFASAAIRDTNALASSAISPNGSTDLTLTILNTLNQAGNYQVSWSADGSSFTNVGTAQPLSANSGLTFVTGTPWLLGYGVYKVTYTATVSPGSGTLYMTLQCGGV